MAWPFFWRAGQPPLIGVALEIDGAVWTQGRHTRGSGYVKDMEKLNAAAELGWRVFRYTPQMVESGAAIRQLERVLR
jgi:hypothetical protein